MLEKIQSHPCFNKDAAGKTARIHLPLIKSCNIQCNYCNRNYNCPNENRPGVTTQLIKPDDVYSLIKKSLVLYPNLEIVGIAGPGEALAEPEVTFDTFRVVRKFFPGLKLCFSSNGLAIVDFIDQIREFNIDFITVTINTLNPFIASRIYQTDNIELLITKQVQGLKELSKLQIPVKVNSVVIPEVNIEDIIDVSKLAKDSGAIVQNLIPFYPVKGSLFENLRPPNKDELEKIRFECSKYMKQIFHCKRCRSDVVGSLLDDKRIFS